MQFCAACGETTISQPCTACGADPLLGGRYALRRLLGQGSHGMTWQAERDGEDVAIKVINLGHGLQAEAQQALDREVAVLRQLSHPCIPRLIDDFSTRSGMTRYRCIVQAFIDGPTLLDELKTTRLTPAQVMTTVAELAEILEHLHGLTPPIIHRDIKPQNLIRRATDQALVLIDFGSVRDTLVGTLGGTMSVGTVGYMAPEQITGEVRPASDLYALGALAVHLLTRQPPQLTHDPSDPIRWRRPDGLPEPIGALVDALLQPRAEDRPESAAVVARQARMLAADPLRQDVSPPLEPPEPPEPPEPLEPPESPDYPAPISDAGPAVEPEPATAPASDAPLTMRPLLVLYPILGVLSIVATVLSLVTIESIMFTGGLGAILGLVVVLVAAPRRQYIGMLAGLSAIGASLFFLLLIVATGMSPEQAAGPIPPLLGGYTFVLLPILLGAMGRALIARQTQRLAQLVTPDAAAAEPAPDALPEYLPEWPPVIGSRREREELKALAQQWHDGVVPEELHVCPFCGVKLRPSELVAHYDTVHLPAASVQRRQQQHLS